MLHALKWTESFFTGLAIVLFGFAVLAVPSQYAMGDDPIGTSEGAGIPCGGTEIDPAKYCATSACVDAINLCPTVPGVCNGIVGCKCLCKSINQDAKAPCSCN